MKLTNRPKDCEYLHLLQGTPREWFCSMVDVEEAPNLHDKTFTDIDTKIRICTLCSNYKRKPIEKYHVKKINRVFEL